MSRTIAVLLSLAILCLQPVHAQDEESTPTKKSKPEFTSPDGRFAFRYTGDPNRSEEEGAEEPSYDLIEKKSGKKLMTVVESNNDIGPSARFSMKVLWRPDSKAFAITAFLWKRGSTLYVYKRDGASFKNVEIPELLAEIPEKEMKGKEYPHISEMNSQEAKRWQKDGSLLVEIESVQDGGDGGTITANRKVILDVNKSVTAEILKSTVKYKITADE